MKRFLFFSLLTLFITFTSCSNDDDGYTPYNQRLIGQWFLTGVTQNGMLTAPDECTSQTYLNFVNLEDVITQSYGKDMNDVCNSTAAEAFKYAVSENLQLVLFDDEEAFNIFDIIDLTGNELTIEDSGNGIQLVFQK
ncbi:lipocalin-like domain-containing protein [Galbibacter mesophilus]|uniref:lipocalin family protein n=1 Tax=Galbibacter mesophilus TaxID=379069 RepID=UPI00191E8373|nr:lipocalin family protein [Galbibacter mesophilus]MCM5661533.1 lipocalin family protein [Galbibacter mesophilus]